VRLTTWNSGGAVSPAKEPHFAYAEPILEPCVVPSCSRESLRVMPRDKVAQQPAATVAVHAQRPGIPVIVEGDTLFEIPEILFTFSPEERVKNHCAS